MMLCQGHSCCQSFTATHVIVSVLLIFLVILLPTHAVDLKKTTGNGPGTTKGIKEIILGRCYDYTTLMKPVLKNVNCENVWNTFKSSFANKIPCKVMPSDYYNFLDLTKTGIATGKSVFWSGINKLAHDYTKVSPEYVTMEDTLSGYLVNNLVWCGRTNGGDGINYERCPAYDDCADSPIKSFWFAASKYFVDAASGPVTVMLSGSADKAFRKDSVFRLLELPVLASKAMPPPINIWVADNIEGPDKESCGKGTVAELEEYLKNKKIKYTCTDNPRAMILLQCAAHPNNSKCKDFYRINP
ncbi:ADP-ribosyl cyclase/cyclic ADP-ribose hydrolase 1-like [Protopterus annectens]|uniref:ADP-ribosyl cyclase/cyclic ADP-ribose hydrolase 1-like n=1 Tax=Protopterus annectens TaxID=7888 RepID=UPI001CFBD720|nr:ADP-ribosyl cyclase/cyclic ADP-ribose hydrolase 1-like [Protopterus annectens]